MKQKLIGIKDVIVAVPVWIFGLCFFIPFGLALLVLSVFINPKHFDPVIKAGCRTVMRLIFVRIRVEGLENFRRDRTFLFMANHVNIFDGIILYGHIPNFVRGVELDKHFDWFFWGAILRRLGMIPISRTNARSAMKSLDKAKQAITGGTSIIILPEGTRTLTGELNPFKRGPFLLARGAGADIVPIAMVGAYRIKQKGNFVIRPGKMVLRFGRPVLYQDFNEWEPNVLREHVRQKISGLFYG